jgi:hypothetical protein
MKKVSDLNLAEIQAGKINWKDFGTGLCDGLTFGGMLFGGLILGRGAIAAFGASSQICDSHGILSNALSF